MARSQARRARPDTYAEIDMEPDRKTNGNASHDLRLSRPKEAATALGLAVAHMMSKPAFASLAFGDWSRVLVGQINRGHYAFVIDGANQVQGFAGWGLVARAKAEVWVEGRYNLTYQDCLEGDCIVFNAWVADSAHVHRFLVDAARKLMKDKQTLYFKRHYKNGGWRPVRLNVNDFVAAHIDRRDTQTGRPLEEASGVRTPDDGGADKGAP
jgi:hemolysin-activating ACP:hemolysin acyltransferase